MRLKKTARASIDPVTIGVIVICLGVGWYMAKKTKHVDHPVEQAAESVLDNYGFEIDFSKDKKDKDKD